MDVDIAIVRMITQLLYTKVNDRLQEVVVTIIYSMMSDVLLTDQLWKMLYDLYCIKRKWRIMVCYVVLRLQKSQVEVRIFDHEDVNC